MNLMTFLPQKWLYGGIVVVVLIAAGAWAGYVKGSDKSALVISNYKAQVVDLNSKLEQAKGKVVEHVITKYKTKIVHIKDVGEHNANVANTIVPSTCTLSDAWVSVHDAAAAGIAADTTSAANGAPSGIKDTEALAVVSSNYDLFHKQKVQLEALQQWITENNATIAAANAKVKKKHWWNK